MNLLRRVLIATIAIVAALLLHARADAACGALPYTFSNNVSIVDATTTNANNSFLLSCAQNVDNTQIGASGIFASQIIPTTVGQATFGGSVGYVFGPFGTTQIPVTLQGANGQTADLFDAFLFGGTKAFWIDSTGNIHEAGALYEGSSTYGATGAAVNGTVTAQYVKIGGLSGSWAPAMWLFNGGQDSTLIHGVKITGTFPASLTTCGPFTNYYCVTIVLTSPATFSSAASWSCTAPAVASAIGSYTVITGGTTNATDPGSTASLNGTTFYIGGSTSNVSGKAFTEYCWGS